jgi:3-hydroxymyristoyl/3-hydroxydecanoyl-(acyl carrier protein) dehydratase
MGESPLHIPQDHPAFGGHFPGHPTVPGVVLIDEALATIADTEGLASRAWHLGWVKFHRPVAPGESLRLRWVALETGGWRFQILTAGQPVATGTAEVLEPK